MLSFTKLVEILFFNSSVTKLWLDNIFKTLLKMRQIFQAVFMQYIAVDIEHYFFGTRRPRPYWKIEERYY